MTEPNCKNNTYGELGSLIRLFINVDGNDVLDTMLDEKHEKNLAQTWQKHPIATLKAGESLPVTAHWSLSGNSYGNEVQSDSVSFKLVFNLIQVTTAPDAQPQQNTDYFSQPTNKTINH